MKVSRILKLALNTVNWEEITSIISRNKAYDKFLKIFSSLYDISFPDVKIKVKIKSFVRPWITKGLLKSSKRKQKLYRNFLI